MGWRICFLSMKKLLFIPLLFLALSLPAQVTNSILFNLQNFVGSAAANRNTLLTPIQLFPPAGVLPILDSISTNSGTGTFTISNQMQGLYRFQILAPPTSTIYTLWIPTNAPANYNAANLVVVPTNSTYPGTTVSWSTTASDGRYIQITNLLQGPNITLATNTNAAGFVTITVSSSGGGGSSIPLDLTQLVTNAAGNLSIKSSASLTNLKSDTTLATNGFTDLGPVPSEPLYIDKPTGNITNTPTTGEISGSVLASAGGNAAHPYWTNLGTAATNAATNFVHRPMIYYYAPEWAPTNGTDAAAGLNAMFLDILNHPGFSPVYQFGGFTYNLSGPVTNIAQGSDMGNLIRGVAHGHEDVLLLGSGRATLNYVHDFTLSGPGTNCAPG